MNAGFVLGVSIASLAIWITEPTSTPSPSQAPVQQAALSPAQAVTAPLAIKDQP